MPLVGGALPADHGSPAVEANQAHALTAAVIELRQTRELLASQRAQEAGELRQLLDAARPIIAQAQRIGPLLERALLELERARGTLDTRRRGEAAELARTLESLGPAAQRLEAAVPMLERVENLISVLDSVEAIRWRR